MSEIDDNRLRERFDDLRPEVQSTMPSFGAQWSRAEAEAAIAPRPRRRTPMWVAAAAVIAIVLGATLIPRANTDRVQTVAASTITTWASPTAGLLRISGSDLIAPPSIISSTLDGVLHRPVIRPGASR